MIKFDHFKIQLNNSLIHFCMSESNTSNLRTILSRYFMDPCPCWSKEKQFSSWTKSFFRRAGVCQLCQAADSWGRGRHAAQTDDRRKKGRQDHTRAEENVKTSPANEGKHVWTGVTVLSSQKQLTIKKATSEIPLAKLLFFVFVF